MSPPSPRESPAFASAAFERYGPELRRYLLRRLARGQDAEDVVQEVFMRLLRIEDRELIRNPRAYLYGIALHVVREFRARQEKSGTWITFEPQEVTRRSEAPEPLVADELPDRIGLQRQLERALQNLPPAHRTVFLLHKRDGFSYEEIAQKLRISAHMVDKYLLQAKVRLRKEWVEE
jgi:RNA polymerase sigma factor (sigma-70 family)